MLVGVAQAQSPSDSSGPVPAATGLAGQGRDGAWRHELKLGVVAGYNDNVTLEPGATLGSRFVAWQPTWSMRRQEPRSQLGLSWRAELLRYVDRSVHNTDNQEAVAEGRHAIGDDVAAAWRVTLQDWHDPVGSNSLARLSNDPDHFVAGAAGVVLRQDVADGGHRLEFEAAVSRKRYQNHREVTVLGDVGTLSTVLRWERVRETGPQWMTEIRNVAADYPFKAAALDNDDARITTGFRLNSVPDAARAHAVQVRVGIQRRSFSRLRPDVEAPTWDLQGRWQVGAGAWLDLGATRAVEVAPGDGADNVTQRGWRAAWTQVWRADLRTTVGASGSALQYRYGGFSDGLPRHDGVRSHDVALRHDWSRDLSLTVTHTRGRRDSSDAANDYRRSLTALGAEWRL